jgi:DNA-binding cell septation regulator SpoVG
VDVNDPQLVVVGSIAGNVAGLSAAASYVRFAIGSYLVHTQPMELGEFSFSVPIGFTLPEVGGALEVGVAARFQWSSNGTAETTVVHIKSASISGGYHVEWDLNPECLAMDDLHLIEDEGGLIIAMPSRCTDDITSSEALIVTAQSTDTSIVNASGEGHNLRIQPYANSYGSTAVDVEVRDESGNSWSDSFTINIAPVPDPPVIEGLPLTVYIELGETMTIEPTISDPDTEAPVISTSRSWATVSPQGVLSLTPVEPGTQTLRLTVSDGTTNVSQDIEVIVTANPDLLVESVEVRYDGIASTSLVRGDVVQIVGFVRNEGRGTAYNVPIHCRLNGILVGSDSIDSIEPGGLKMAVCDAQLNEASLELSILVEVDGTSSIQETNEANNLLEATISVEQPTDPSKRPDSGTVVIFVSVCVIFASLVILQMGPRGVKKEFERRK